eukprot:2240663-Prymnesium_polylepis.1
MCALPRTGRTAALADDLLARRAPARPTNVRSAGPARGHSSARAREDNLVGVLLETRSSTLSEPARARTPLCDLDTWCDARFRDRRKMCGLQTMRHSNRPAGAGARSD